MTWAVMGRGLLHGFIRRDQAACSLGFRNVGGKVWHYSHSCISQKPSQRLCDAIYRLYD